MVNHRPRTLLLTRRLPAAAASLMLITVMPLAGGCDRESAQFARMQRVLEQAMTTIDQAEAGFVPVDAKAYDAGVTKQDIEINPPKIEEIYEYGAYRQDRLGDAVGDLETVAENGSPGQRAIAKKMLAMIDASAARTLSRRAVDASARLNADASASLFELLEVIESTDAAANVLDQNDEGLVTELEARVQALTQRRDEVADQVEELTGQREAALAREAAQREKSTQLIAEAQSFASAAFESEGDGKYALLDRESEAKRKAAVASNQADEHQQQAEALAVRLAPLQSRLASLNEALDAVTENRAAAAQRQEDGATSRRLLAEDRDKAFEELLTRFERLSTAYADSVVAEFDRAQRRAQSAISRLEEAEQLTPPDARDALVVERLAALGDLANIHTRRAVAANAMASLTGSLIKGLGRTGVAEATPLAESRSAVEESVATHVEAANEVIARAEQLAKRIDNEASDRLVASIREHTAQLPTP